MIRATTNYRIPLKGEVARNTAFVEKSGRRAARYWEVIFCPTGDFLGSLFLIYLITFCNHQKSQFLSSGRVLGTHRDALQT